MLPVPELLGTADEHAEANPPKFGTVVGILLLPLVLGALRRTRGTPTTTPPLKTPSR